MQDPIAKRSRKVAEMASRLYLMTTNSLILFVQRIKPFARYYSSR